MGDIGCHLRNDGYLYALLHASGIGFYQFRTLPHVATHTLVLHLRTREVQLHGIAAGLLSHLRQPHPLILGLSHNRGDDHFRGIVLLQSAQNVEVFLYWVLAQLFHITETVEVAVRGIVVHSVKTWRHLLDLLQTNGLIKDTCPAGIECFRYHRVVGTYRRRGEEERILTLDAAKHDIERRSVDY